MPTNQHWTPTASQSATTAGGAIAMPNNCGRRHGTEWKAPKLHSERPDEGLVLVLPCQFFPFSFTAC
jgi:hypothetical protein